MIITPFLQFKASYRTDKEQVMHTVLNINLAQRIVTISVPKKHRIHRWNCKPDNGVNARILRESFDNVIVHQFMGDIGRNHKAIYVPCNQ